MMSGPLWSDVPRVKVVQAVAFLVNEVLLEPASAAAEVRRYCMSPTQPSSYMLGRLAMLDLREEVKRRAGAAFSLGDFHARLLSAGTLPVPLVRAHLIEEEEVAVPAVALPRDPQDLIRETMKVVQRGEKRTR